MDTNQPATLLGRVREVIRYKHYSIRTERAYVDWIRRFVNFHGRKHPRKMGADEVRAFLGHLTSGLDVAVSTHQQALSELLFLYRDVLELELPWIENLSRPTKAKRLPTVLSQAEVEALFLAMSGTHALMARLLYGTGMRLMECLRLRVKDVDFDLGEILIRDGKGAKDRVTVLPRSLVAELREHLRRVRGLWQGDRDLGAGRGAATGCAGAQVPECAAGMGVVLGFPGA